MPDGRFRVRSDRTPFFPTGGGQPHDTGRLGESRVVDVRLEGDVVIHVTEAAVQGSVRAVVDATRRLDHSRQHTGQHLASALFLARHGAATTSFHLGLQSSTIDLDCELDEGALCDVEDAALEIIAAALQITTSEVSPKEARGLEFRREPDDARIQGDKLRIVDIPGVDLQACCGTHCPTTAAIAGLRLTGRERHKGGTRVSFVAGPRALLRDREASRRLSAVAGRLSSADDEVAAQVDRMIEREKSLRKELEATSEKLLDVEAEALIADSSLPCIRIYPDRDPAELGGLARRVCRQPGQVVFLATISGSTMRLQLARSTDTRGDMRQLLEKLSRSHDLKGGGRPDQASGGGRSSDPDALLAQLSELWRRSDA